MNHIGLPISSLFFWHRPINPKTAVKGLDLERYMGRWYEIASLRSSPFQPRDGADTRATYGLRQDGTVSVVNETWSSGKRGFVEGTVFKADPSSDEARLKVRFYVPPIWPVIPVVGDDWVLYVDEGYRVALVGHPSGKYLWITSREPHLDEDTYNELVKKAAEKGYDVSNLRKTPQSPTSPEEDGPVDTIGIWWIKSIFGM